MLTFAQGLSVADILGPHELDDDVIDSFLKNRQAASYPVPTLYHQPADPIGQRCILLYTKSQARNSLRKAYKREWKEVCYEDF